MQKRHLVVTTSILLFGVLILLGVSLFGRNPTGNQNSSEDSIVFLGEPDQYQNEGIVMERGKRSSATEIAPMTDGDEQNRYDSARETYRDRTLTFDQNCRALPTTLAIPRRTVVMFDNRSDQWRGISLGERTVSMKPMDFILVQFNKPGSILVHCNDIENVALLEVI